MSDRDSYIPGVPCWIDTNQPDPEAAVAFYRDLFGWEFEDVMPRGRRSGTTWRASAVATWRPSGPPGGSTAGRSLEHLCVGARRRRHRRPRVKAGGGALMEPVDVRRPVGWRRLRPGGRRFAFGRPSSTEGRAIVNEDGSVNFNDLDTRDLGGARGRSTARCSVGRR